MTTPTPTDDQLVDMIFRALSDGLVDVRFFAERGDAAKAAELADLLHNMPDVLRMLQTGRQVDREWLTRDLEAVKATARRLHEGTTQLPDRPVPNLGSFGSFSL